MCTTPVPSSVATNSAPTTRRAGASPASTCCVCPSTNASVSTPSHARDSNSGSYSSLTSAEPRNRASTAPSSTSGSTARRRSSATTSRRSSTSTSAYSASGETASAVLPGSVHGVVVHASTAVDTPSSRRSAASASAFASESDVDRSSNSTVTLGSSVSSR